MRIGVGLALAALLCVAPGCKREKKTAVLVGQEANQIPFYANMGDVRSAKQLVAGFHDVEDGAWRWTSKQFVIELGTPLGAGANGARLEFRLTVPPVVIEKNQSITLSAAVDGNVLPPETYSKPGEYIYKRDVPASLLGGKSVKISFEVDKTLAPGGADQRVLGVVASSAALYPR